MGTSRRENKNSLKSFQFRYCRKFQAPCPTWKCFCANSSKFGLSKRRVLLPTVKSDPRFLWFWFAALCDWLEKGRAILLTNDKSLAYQNQWHLCHTRFCTLAQFFTMRYLSTCKLNFREYKWELSRVFPGVSYTCALSLAGVWLHEGQSLTN